MGLPDRVWLCPICGALAHLALLKEGNVSCADYFEGCRLFAQDRGDIALAECAACGFAWMPQLHAWDEARFRRDIYNADYVLCDPPFVDERPRKLAHWLAPLCGARSVLDYGGGDGKLARLLGAQGIEARSFDPFYDCAPLPQDKFDLVTAFEIVEHVAAQAQLFAALRALLKPDAALVFSTLLKPSTLSGDYWYASARNGHISLHSEKSLALCMDQAKLAWISLSEELHVAAPRAASLEAWRGAPKLRISGTPAYQTAPPWREFTPIGNSLSAPTKTA